MWRGQHKDCWPPYDECSEHLIGSIRQLRSWADHSRLGLCGLERNFNIHLAALSELPPDHMPGGQQGPEVNRAIIPGCSGHWRCTFVNYTLWFSFMLFITNSLFSIHAATIACFCFFHFSDCESFRSFCRRHRNGDPMAANWTGWPQCSFPSLFSFWGILWSSQAGNVWSVQRLF